VIVQWFSPGTVVSSTNKTDHHVIIEILLKVVLSTISLTPLSKDHYCPGAIVQGAIVLFPPHYLKTITV